MLMHKFSNPCLSDHACTPPCARNFLTFVSTTAIAYRYGQKIDQSLRVLVAYNSGRFYKRQKIASTRNFLTFVNTTAIAYGQIIDQSLKILPICHSSRFYKRQEITSTRVHFFFVK